MAEHDPHADELLHRTRTMALGLVASFAGGALLILGLGGSKPVAALVFAVGLAAGGLALRHTQPDASGAPAVSDPASAARTSSTAHAVRQPARSVQRAAVAPIRSHEEIVDPGEATDDDIDLEAAAPAVDAVMQAMADLRDEASATEALLQRMAARRSNGRAAASGAIRAMTNTDAPASPLA